MLCKNCTRLALKFGFYLKSDILKLPKDTLIEFVLINQMYIIIKLTLSCILIHAQSTKLIITTWRYLLHVTGNGVCPSLPRPSPCPNQPNQCVNKRDCSTGQECCSDGCRMICVQPVLAALRSVPTTKAVKTFREYLLLCSVVVPVV